MLSPINMLIWNIQGASQKGSLHYVVNICHKNKVRLLILLERLFANDRLESIRKHLSFNSTHSSIDGKIWIA